MCFVKHERSQLFTHHSQYINLHGINTTHIICIGTVFPDGPQILAPVLSIVFFIWLYSSAL